MFPEITRDDVFRLETRRLWLRWAAVDDGAALAAIAGPQAVAEMTINVPHPYPKGEASRQIERWRDANASGAALTLVMTGHAADRTPFGVVGLEPIPDPSSAALPLADAGAPGAPRCGAKIGLLLAPERWGLGLGTEAMQAMVDAAFVLTPITHIEGSIRVVNPGARRVFERCGFAYEATVLRIAAARGGMVPCDCFRLDRKTWTSLKQWRMPIPAPPFAVGYGPRRPDTGPGARDA